MAGSNSINMLNKLQPQGSTQPTSFYDSPAFASAVSGAAGAASNYYGNKAAGEQSAASAAQQAEIDRQRRRMTMQLALAGTGSERRSDQLSRDQAALNSTQMDPVRQQKDIAKAAFLRELASQGAPQASPGSVSRPDLSGAAKQFLNNDTLASAAARFYGAAGAMSDTSPPADLASMGFGGGGGNAPTYNPNGFNAGAPGAGEASGVRNTGVGSLQSQMNETINNARAGRRALDEQQRGDIQQGINENADPMNDEVKQHVAMKDDNWLNQNAPPPAGYHWNGGELSADGSGFWHKLTTFLAPGMQTLAEKGHMLKPWEMFGPGKNPSTSQGPSKNPSPPLMPQSYDNPSGGPTPDLTPAPAPTPPRPGDPQYPVPGEGNPGQPYPPPVAAIPRIGNQPAYFNPAGQDYFNRRSQY